ncbi:hypothetical protein G9A89_004544 [Geosiphon pyriformis]|nr:hypothetical protein G9A89_004544 [Geosiphon pyriformis]
MENNKKNISGETPSTYELMTAKTIERNFSPWELGLPWTKTIGQEPTITINHAIENAMDTQNDRESGTTNHVLLVVNSFLMKECGMTFLVKEEHVTLHANIPYSLATGEILKIKNNSPEPTDIVLVLNSDVFLNLENSPEDFHKHYQNLTPIREEQKECLAQLNTQLCDHCLIPCDFQYCNESDLIYNPSIHMIYTISEEEPISSCTSKSELILNSDSNFNNDDDENNGSSSAPISNKNYNNSNFDSDSETFIALPNLIKEQELK